MRTFDTVRQLGYHGYALHPNGLRPLDEFDVARDQLAFSGREFCADAMPPGYVRHFLFVPFGRDATALLSPRPARHS